MNCKKYLVQLSHLRIEDPGAQREKASKPRSHGMDSNFLILSNYDKRHFLKMVVTIFPIPIRLFVMWFFLLFVEDVEANSFPLECA